MAIDYAKLKSWRFPPLMQSYSEKDVILYALAVGVGQNPIDPIQLRYTFEKNLRALPTVATVLATPGFWMRDEGTGIDWRQLLHGEQRTQFHAPIPISGSVYSEMRVLSISDKGQGKGAIVVSQRKLLSEAGELLATLQQSTFCRGNGGYSADGQSNDPGPEPLPAVPQRPPDATVEVASRPEAALLYRLAADPNPLHADPDVAHAAGFDRPILHGLATYGMAGQAVVFACCGGDASRLRAFDTRFTAPVYPGETLLVDIWREGARTHFRGRIASRNVVVLSNGIALIED
ncbi:MaoC/PaaZ C-terminal domain-containing protein [Variovorax sp. VNK109]|uniref:MaoC/PaaZ C-terminal domain-containing protein n=1 Tax=Variovorax sp. VNK109 TaxID=3400919 RepID=UPI003C115401